MPSNVLEEVDDSVGARGEDPGLAWVEGYAQHAYAANDAVAAQHLERHDERVLRQIAMEKKMERRERKRYMGERIKRKGKRERG